MIVLDPHALVGVRSRLFWEGTCAGGWHEPPRLLYDTELVITSAGSFVLEIEGQPTVMRPGAAALIPPETWHESRVEPGGRTLRSCLHFSWSDVDLRQLPLMATSRSALHPRLVQRPPASVRSRLPVIVEPEAMRAAQPLVRLLLQQARCGGALVDACLNGVVGWMLSVGHPRFAPTRAHPALAVKQWIDEHYARPLGSRDFQRVAGLTRSHLSAIFHQLVGAAPTAYLTQVRLHHAMRLLRAGQPIAAVARAVGIADANYFARLFRKHLGRSPSAWCRAQDGDGAAP